MELLNHQKREDGEHKNPHQEFLDAKWFPRIEKLFFESYEYLAGKVENRNAERDKFIAGEIKNPELDYPNLEDFDFSGREKALLNLKADILQSEPNKVVAQAYRWRINEDLASVRMLKAARDGDDRRFSRYADFLFGKPQLPIFKYTMAAVKAKSEKAKVSGDARRVEAAQSLERLIPKAFEMADAEAVAAAKSLPETTKDEGDGLSAAEIKKVFEGAMQEIGLKTFRIEIDQKGNRTSLSVSQETRTAYIPSDEKIAERKSGAITLNKARGLIAHELGTHALRRENGERTKLHLLSIGLDRYIKGEEGVATYNQQQVEGAKDFAGFAGYFSASLAKGLDGTPRDFRQVWEVLVQYNLMNDTKEKSLLDHQKTAFNSAVRIFRGTTCQTAGAIYSKDIAYREGNIGIWQLVAENPEEEKRFMVGKYDPTNPNHIWILEQLGINEKDLEDLES